MKLLLISALVLLLTVTSGQAHAHGHDLTEHLMEAQDDLSSAHMFFQLQLSMMTENFDDLMDILGQRIHPNIAKGVDDFTDRLEETEEELEGAHPSCLREFAILSRRFGRQISHCTFSSMYEIMWMQNYHQYLTWYSEYMSNAVPMEGMELFTFWDVLTDTESDPILIINNQLRDSLNLFLTDHNAELGWLEGYVYDYFDDITFESYFCPYSMIGRWWTATTNLINDAADGSCDGEEESFES